MALKAMDTFDNCQRPVLLHTCGLSEMLELENSAQFNYCSEKLPLHRKLSFFTVFYTTNSSPLLVTK